MLDQRFAASIHIMLVMAHRHGELLTSDYLAQSLRTNPTVVRRLLAKLVEAHLIDSFKGKSGGVRLVKPTEQISLRDIYQAVSNKSLIHCSDKEPQEVCAVSCAFKKIFSGISNGLEKSSMDYLQQIKLSELSHKI